MIEMAEMVSRDSHPQIHTLHVRNKWVKKSKKNKGLCSKSLEVPFSFSRNRSLKFTNFPVQGL